jgi:hypothetical protein
MGHWRDFEARIFDREIEMSRQASFCAATPLGLAGYPIITSAPHSGSDFWDKRTDPSRARPQVQPEILRFRSASAGYPPGVEPSAAKGFPAKALRMRRERRR